MITRGIQERPPQPWNAMMASWIYYRNFRFIWNENWWSLLQNADSHDGQTWKANQLSFDWFTGNFTGHPLYLMVKPWFPVRFSLEPIQWKLHGTTIWASPCLRSYLAKLALSLSPGLAIAGGAYALYRSKESVETAFRDVWLRMIEGL